jgi:hypothetical protein
MVRERMGKRCFLRWVRPCHGGGEKVDERRRMGGVSLNGRLQ